MIFSTIIGDNHTLTNLVSNYHAHNDVLAASSYGQANDEKPLYDKLLRLAMLNHNPDTFICVAKLFNCDSYAVQLAIDFENYHLIDGGLLKSDNTPPSNWQFLSSFFLSQQSKPAHSQPYPDEKTAASGKRFINEFENNYNELTCDYKQEITLALTEHIFLHLLIYDPAMTAWKLPTTLNLDNNNNDELEELIDPTLGMFRKFLLLLGANRRGFERVFNTHNHFQQPQRITTGRTPTKR